MHVIGLTGGMAMGKSHASKVFRRHRIPVFDADASVHRLQDRGGAAIGPLTHAFPGTVRDGRVDRMALRAAVLGHAANLRTLEAIMHPLVRAEQNRFLTRHRRAHRRIVVLDVPLLLETGGDRACDLVAVVSAPAAVQRQRLARRRGLTQPQIAAMLARQMSDSQRRRHADVLIRTGLSRHHAQRQLRRLIAALA